MKRQMYDGDVEGFSGGGSCSLQDRNRMMEYILITSRVRMALKRDADEAEGFQSR